MADSVRAAIQDRIGFRAILTWLGFVAITFWFLDGSIAQMGTSLVMTVVLGLSELLSEVYDLRGEVRSFGFGLVALLSSVALFVLGGTGTWWLPVLFAAIGGWISLDAVQTLRHEGLTVGDDDTDETPDGRDVYHDYVTRQVDETLREERLTRRELSTALDPDDAAIDRALAELDDRDLLVREGSELETQSPPEPGTMARARDLAATAAARLARPLTVEFDDESTTGDETERYDPTPERADSRSRSDADRDREREPAGRR
ncbi:MFS transporter [Halococcus saccharolyticus]|uniref:Uncharacterized protein n=1 Tax=Halococcus saccharolyticus DSM 5350 TaxID=1227455 RepID=M0MPK2_9EURY|nr:MFS transporter [Halococcus saccharolyticus]EMA46659.1 hypothetical protein C449_03296 [Halococcus saccharolyticus DSM 5350]